LNPKICIIIAAYNAEKFLSKTIDGVLSQTFNDWHLVVVNDGSTDNTVAIVQNYILKDTRIRLISQFNQGCSTARNAGLASAGDAPYIIFLDSDDVWDPHALSTLYEYFERHPEHVGIYGSARYIDKHDNEIRPGQLERACRIRATYVNGRVISLSADEPMSFNTLVVDSCMATPGVVLLRHDAIKQSGNFDTTLGHAEDWDFFLRLSRLGTYKFLDEVILSYRMHDSNKSAQREKYREAFRRIRIKTMESRENTPEQRRIAIASYTASQRFFIAEKSKYIAAAVSNGDWPESAMQFKYAMGHVAKLVRGRP